MEEKEQGSQAQSRQLMCVDSDGKKISRHPELDHLITVYNNQTAGEKGDGVTLKKNNTGFNRHDAPILTAIAENYLERGYVSADEFAIASRLIRKYHAQWGE